MGQPGLRLIYLLPIEQRTTTQLAPQDQQGTQSRLPGVRRGGDGGAYSVPVPDASGGKSQDRRVSELGGLGQAKMERGGDEPIRRGGGLLLLLPPAHVSKAPAGTGRGGGVGRRRNGGGTEEGVAGEELYYIPVIFLILRRISFVPGLSYINL